MLLKKGVKIGLKAPISLQRFSAVAVVQRCFQVVQRCFYSVVSLKSVAVAHAFSAAYVCGPVRWNVRFSLTCGRIGGTCTFRLFICKEFRTPGFQPIFNVLRVHSILISEFGGTCTFRDTTSGRYNNQAFHLQIAGLVLLESLIFSTFYIVF